MRLVVVGAGSQSTPSLFLTRELLELSPELAVTLVGSNDEKTAAIASAVTAIAPQYRLRIANIMHDLNESFANADVILIQARYGRYDARRFDETFPLRFRSPGDEGLGMGGLANAWRSWPHLHALLNRIEASGSTAAIVFLTAPLPILTRCALAAHPALRWYAVCELPFATLKHLSETLSIDWRDIDYDYAGTNHLGWFDRLHLGSLDLIERLMQTPNSGGFPSAALIRRLGAVPLKYLEIHYDRHAVVERQRAQLPRSDILESLAQRALAAFKSGHARDISAALDRRNAPWYGDAVAPLISWLAGNPTKVPLFLTTTNGCYLPELLPEDVVEIPHVAGARLEPRERRRPLAPELAQTLQSFVEFERLAAHAVLQKSTADIADAIRTHPWVQPGDAPEIARVLVNSAPVSAVIER
jgi:alpha-galactosidase/6-phospho-beta-glucosidase family protein